MKQNESQNVEYKRIWHDEYLRWVCGFANAKGGTIWIGIDDDKSVAGVTNAEKLMEDIPNKIKDTMGIVVDISLVRRQCKDVVRIDIPESDFPVAYRGEYHYRTGSTKQQLTGFALTQFLFHKMHLSWDAVETVNRLRANNYTFKRLKLRFDTRVQKTIRPADLASFGLVTKEGILTNAGALLVDDCPIPQSRLFCTRWTGPDKSFDAEDSQKEHGNLLELLDSAEAFIKKHTRKAWVKRPTERDNYPDYPERAVTEALVNAFIHRDYTIYGSEVHVDIFDERIEISSPGGMPDGSLVQDLDLMNVPSDRRNGVLADIFDRLDYMEREGSGFKKILGAYSFDKARNSMGVMPKFYSAVGCFIVTLPCLRGKNDTINVTVNDIINVTVNDHLKPLYELICDNPGKRTPFFAKQLKMAERTIKRQLAELSDVVEYRGAKRDGGYFLRGGVGNRCEVAEKVAEKVAVKLTETEKKILDMLRGDAHVTQKTISDRIGVTRQYVGRCMDSLQSRGLIRRIGPDKGGVWEVVK